MKSAIQDFKAFVRKKGLRNTPEREELLRAVFSIDDHFDVDDLYLRLRKQEAKISKATIYRTIPLLLESGLIQKAFFEDGHQYYEHICGNPEHCHLRCLGCGTVVEFVDESVREVERHLGERHGFLITGHRLEVYGYCPKCKAKH
jgi:Fur family ferric uptake transcriptional regulator